jgi:methionine-gamma-lyase
MTQPPSSLRKDTIMVHGTSEDFCVEGDLGPPVHLTSAYRLKSAEHGAELFAGKAGGYIYTRIANPTVDLFQQKMAAMEKAEAALAAASGLAAIAAVVMTMAGQGDNLLACTTLYGGTYALFSADIQRFGVQTRWFAPRLKSPENTLVKMADSRTRLIYLETPANPTLDILDIGRFAGIAQGLKIPLVVDNTFATPWLQTPLSMGADMVVHSATKYLGGHADILGGVVAGDGALIHRIHKAYMEHFGPALSPFNAWLILRGIKTLGVRMQRHCDSAARIAAWLDRHRQVARVYYPGLKSHPGHRIARRQMSGFGGMIAFEVKGGLLAGKAMMNRMRLCTLAVSLGDCQTLIQHPASMTHATYSPAQRQAAGITEGLIRLSVGIEDVRDIIDDLDQAMATTG